jgi:radical SAM enzyme (TIGR01210 family)
MAQVDFCIRDSAIAPKLKAIKKIILSNNGSILDQETFSSTALMYLLAQLNLHVPNLKVLSIETRPEYVDLAELEFLARALKEGKGQRDLEIAIGIEAHDERIRNDIYCKGISFQTIESLVADMAPYGFFLKCYFMQKPVPEMSDEAGIEDIHRGIEYLDGLAKQYGIRINMHLNPTYVARGTVLEEAFQEGRYHPPYLLDVARAAAWGRDKNLSIFIGLSDEGLAAPGGSFLRENESDLVEKLEQFNRTQDYRILEEICLKEDGP